MSQEKLREEFEATLKGAYLLMHDKSYADPHIEARWQTWKACAAIKDAEIAGLRVDLKRQMEHNNFDSTRLQRLATFCGVSCPESQEELLQVAGVVIGSCMRVLESNAKEFKTEIASRDLMIKELQSVVDRLLTTKPGAEFDLAIFDAKQLLAKSEHHDSRALDKMLLEARIEGFILADEVQDTSYEFTLEVMQAKLAELNKE